MPPKRAKRKYYKVGGKRKASSKRKASKKHRVKRRKGTKKRKGSKKRKGTSVRFHGKMFRGRGYGKGAARRRQVLYPRTAGDLVVYPARTALDVY